MQPRQPALRLHQPRVPHALELGLHPDNALLDRRQRFLRARHATVPQPLDLALQHRQRLVQPRQPALRLHQPRVPHALELGLHRDDALLDRRQRFLRARHATVPQPLDLALQHRQRLVQPGQPALGLRQARPAPAPARPAARPTPLQARQSALCLHHPHVPHLLRPRPATRRTLLERRERFAPTQHATVAHPVDLALHHRHRLVQPGPARPRPAPDARPARPRARPAPRQRSLHRREPLLALRQRTSRTPRPRPAAPPTPPAARSARAHDDQPLVADPASSPCITATAALLALQPALGLHQTRVPQPLQLALQPRQRTCSPAAPLSPAATARPARPRPRPAARRTRPAAKRRCARRRPAARRGRRRARPASPPPPRAGSPARPRPAPDARPARCSSSPCNPSNARCSPARPSSLCRNRTSRTPSTSPCSASTPACSEAALRSTTTSRSSRTPASSPCTASTARWSAPRSLSVRGSRLSRRHSISPCRPARTSARSRSPGRVPLLERQRRQAVVADALELTRVARKPPRRSPTSPATWSTRVSRWACSDRCDRAECLHGRKRRFDSVCGVATVVCFASSTSVHRSAITLAPRDRRVRLVDSRRCRPAPRASSGRSSGTAQRRSRTPHPTLDPPARPCSGSGSPAGGVGGSLTSGYACSSLALALDVQRDRDPHVAVQVQLGGKRPAA